MASTYSALKIELIGTGEQSGTWGDTTNTNLGTAIEEAIVGVATATFATDADLTLTLTNVNTSQVARNLVLNCVSSGSLTATRDLIVPAIEKPYIVKNNTTGGQSIRVIVAGGSVTVPNGRSAFVYNDGTDITTAIDYTPAVYTQAVEVLGTTSSGGYSRFYEDADNGTNYVQLQAPDSVASNVTFKLPSADGTSGQAVVTDGSGNLSFGSAGISTGKSIAMAMIFGF
jgi:hypothetical protein